MPSFSADAIARFEEVLRKDPNSQVFAPLADVYRTEARLAEDEPPELPEDDEAADLPPPPADVLARARGARAARSASDLTG